MPVLLRAPGLRRVHAADTEQSERGGADDAMEEGDRRRGFDVVVVGAGIMGSCAAYAAACRGARVLLLERFDLLHHRGSSHGESRTIRATYTQAHYPPMVRLAARLWDGAQRDAGYRVLTPTPHLDMGPRGDAALRAAIENGGAVEFPIADGPWAGVFRLPQGWTAATSSLGGVMKATKAVAMFQALAVKKGAVVRDRTEVVDVTKQAGKLQIVNSVLTALPTYTMCMFLLPMKVIKRIDQARRACLWRGNSQGDSMKPMVKWEIVCKPKEKGGLGVINLRAQNNALMVKMLDKFYNKQDIPWINLIWHKHYNSGQVPHLQSIKGSAWWKGVLKLIPNFLAIARPLVNNGATASIWFDLWTDTPIHLQLGRLFTFVKHQKWSIQKFKEQVSLDQSFFLPLSTEAEQELAFLQQKLIQSTNSADANDLWKLIWGNGPYQSKDLYAYTFNQMVVHPVYKWLWRSHCATKIKVFFWLLLKDRLNTRDILQRKTLIQDDEDCLCPLCDQHSKETSQHLFIDCHFAYSCWEKLDIFWPPGESLEEQIAMIKSISMKKFIIDILLVGTWTIWLHRNGCIFRRQEPSIASWWADFKDCLILQSNRIKIGSRSEFLVWIA